MLQLPLRSVLDIMLSSLPALPQRHICHIFVHCDIPVCCTCGVLFFLWRCPLHGLPSRKQVLKPLLRLILTMLSRMNTRASLASVSSAQSPTKSAPMEDALDDRLRTLKDLLFSGLRFTLIVLDSLLRSTAGQMLLFGSSRQAGKPVESGSRRL